MVLPFPFQIDLGAIDQFFALCIKMGLTLHFRLAPHLAQISVSVPRSTRQCCSFVHVYLCESAVIPCVLLRCRQLLRQAAGEQLQKSTPLLVGAVEAAHTLFTDTRKLVA
jgi:hypothetical protein